MTPNLQPSDLVPAGLPHKARDLMTGTPGSVFVVAAPSGAGKTSLVKHLLTHRPHIQLSVSYTTRKPRPGEQNGVDYNFVDVTTFEQNIAAGDLLEWAKVHGNYYGTSASWVAEKTRLGIDIVLEIDWQGTRQVAQRFDDLISIFILPPSLQTLHDRLKARGQDDEQTIERRLLAAAEEISHVKEYQYVIINQDFSIAVATLCAVADSARARTSKQLSANPELYDALVK